MFPYSVMTAVSMLDTVADRLEELPSAPESAELALAAIADAPRTAAATFAVADEIEMGRAIQGGVSVRECAGGARFTLFQAGDELQGNESAAFSSQPGALP